MQDNESFRKTKVLNGHSPPAQAVSNQVLGPDAETQAYVPIGYPAPSAHELLENKKSLHGVSVGDWDSYELLEEIGRGGMGMVFKARQKRLDRIVAIKVIRCDHPPRPDEIDRFEREMIAAAKLDHPGIVSIFDAGTHDGSPFYVMAYVNGGTLADLIAKGPLQIVPALRIAQRLAEAAAYSHSQGVIHRDLKPTNVLIDSDGRPRIADFGLAKLLGDRQRLTASGVVMGSLPFMAPEQAAGRNAEIGPGVDIYAVGAILYTMLAGRPPFGCDDALQLLRRLRTEMPPAIRLARPDVPAGVEEILRRCLAKSATERFESAAELAQVIVATASEPAGPARETAVVATHTISPPSPAAPTLGNPQQGKRILSRWLKQLGRRWGK